MPTDGLKDPCYAGLTEQQVIDARAADDIGNLDLLKLICSSCGQTIGAKVMPVYKLPPNAGKHFEADPYPHERPKAQRPRARKRGPRKLRLLCRWPGQKVRQVAGHKIIRRSVCPIHPQFHRGWVGDHESQSMRSRPTPASITPHKRACRQLQVVRNADSLRE
jgi:hypothetical protein